MSIARELAVHVAGLHHAGLPDAVREQALKCLLDSVGNMLGARSSPKARLVDAHARGSRGAPEATVVGGERTGCAEAAFANAALARMHDLDDGHQVAMGHPASVLVPVALALGQALPVGGRDVLTALVAAYDVYAGLGAAINPSAYHDRGFDATGIVGCVAAGALAARLRGLGVEHTDHAMGIAATQAGGIIESQNDGSSGKLLCPAWAARAGLLAADLALAGFTGSAAVFEGPRGHFQAFSNHWDGARATLELGRSFGIQDNYFKLHACMRGLHGAVDAALMLQQQGALWRDAARIRVRTSSFVARLARPHPADPAQAQCSLPYCVAVALRFGRVGQPQMAAGLGDPDIAALQDLTEVVVDESLEQLRKREARNWGAAEVIVETRQGQELRQRVLMPRGGAEHPLSTHDLEAKFREQIAGTGLAARGDAILAEIAAFEQLDSIGRLMDLLAAR